jgi:cytidylate kinase
MRELIVAIDGPSGAGKSTLSKLLARRLGYINLDTGAMYRAVALAARRLQIDPEDNEALGRLALKLSIDFLRMDNGRERVLLDGEDVSEAIRAPEVSLLTSRVSACPAVREAMVRRQRELGAEGGVVLEGRDIGSVVFPDAEVKFFLKATAEERGRRRYEELKAKGTPITLQQTIANVEARDTADSKRQYAPLLQADDAVAIDTTALSIEEVLSRMLSLVSERRLASGLPAREF